MSARGIFQILGITRGRTAYPQFRKAGPGEIANRAQDRLRQGMLARVDVNVEGASVSRGVHGGELDGKIDLHRCATLEHGKKTSILWKYGEYAV